MSRARKVLLFLVATVTISSCFVEVDINNDIHDNPVNIGDACDLLRDKFGKPETASAESELNICPEEQTCSSGEVDDSISPPYSSSSSSSVSSSSGGQDLDAGTPVPKEVGYPCSLDEECLSDFCLCDICIDPAQLL